MSFQLCFAGRIARADSIFKYVGSTTYETFNTGDFVPLFLQEVLDKMSETEQTEIEQKCKGNKECIFDYAVTGKYTVSYKWLSI